MLGEDEETKEYVRPSKKDEVLGFLNEPGHGESTAPPRYSKIEGNPCHNTISTAMDCVEWLFHPEHRAWWSRNEDFYRSQHPGQEEPPILKEFSERQRDLKETLGTERAEFLTRGTWLRLQYLADLSPWYLLVHWRDGTGLFSDKDVTGGGDNERT